MNDIINRHIIDTTTVPQKTDLWDIATYLYAQGESAMYQEIKRVIHHNALLTTENKNLKAWRDAASTESLL